MYACAASAPPPQCGVIGTIIKTMESIVEAILSAANFIIDMIEGLFLKLLDKILPPLAELLGDFTLMIPQFDMLRDKLLEVHI